MSYTAPTISSSGLTIPSYSDILADLIASAQSIYGSDIYLGNDSLDYQFISIFALKMSDSLKACQLAYNERSPSTAIGSGLDSIVKLNGIARKTASYSTCEVTLTGTSGTIITGGIVADVSNNLWSLPSPITIGSGGTISVTATCQTIGAITATIGTLTTISTPTQGWVSVTNPSAAIPGQPIETDSELRSRQAVSTELPSQTLLGGTLAGIASVTNITRYVGYENDTNIVDSNGLPPHSITIVAEGGTDLDIAEQIFIRKNIGCYTNGTTIEYISDSNGIVTPIRFYRPTYVPVYVTINIKSLKNYTSSIVNDIKTNVAAYLNSLQIGDDLPNSSLWGAALTALADLKNPSFSITSLIAGTSSGSQSSADISVLFNEVVQGNTANITVNVS